MRGTRLAVPVLAVAVAATSLIVALALPMYTCKGGYRFEIDRGAGGGPTCWVSDVGYRPHSWVPTKIAVAAGGVVAAFVVLLWRRRRMAAIGIAIAFAAMTTAWFIPDGFEQTFRNGHPVCCGHFIDRGALRVFVGVAGTAGALAFVVAGFLRGSTRRHERQVSLPGT